MKIPENENNNKRNKPRAKELNGKEQLLFILFIKRVLEQLDTHVIE